MKKCKKCNKKLNSCNECWFNAYLRGDFDEKQLKQLKLNLNENI